MPEPLAMVRFVVALPLAALYKQQRQQVQLVLMPNADHSRRPCPNPYVLLVGFVCLFLVWCLAVGHFCILDHSSSPRICRPDSYLLDALLDPTILILIFTTLQLLSDIPPLSIIVSVIAFVPVFVFIIFTLYIYFYTAYCPVYSYGGLLLAVLAFLIIAASLFVNYRWQSGFVSVFFIVLASVLFTLLFVLPVVDVRSIDPTRTPEQKYGCTSLSPPSAPSSFTTLAKSSTGVKYNIANTTEELIKSEHLKAVDEIKQRSQINDDWFHNKFIVVGGLLAAILIHLRGLGPLGPEKPGTTVSAVSDLENLFKKTIIPASILGIACVVSLAIDIHIGNNQMIVQQLAHWIKNCVETLLNKDPDYYMGWETFIRINNHDAKGMHMDYIFNLKAYAVASGAISILSVAG